MNFEQGLWWERNIEQPGVAHDTGAKPARVLNGALTGSEAEEKIIPRATSTGST